MVLFVWVTGSTNSITIPIRLCRVIRCKTIINYIHDVIAIIVKLTFIGDASAVRIRTDYTITVWISWIDVTFVGHRVMITVIARMIRNILIISNMVAVAVANVK